MTDNYSLIIKNGSCYIEGKFQNIDLALSENKIKKIGKIDLNSSKVIDASGKFILESQEQMMLKIWRAVVEQL